MICRHTLNRCSIIYSLRSTFLSGHALAAARRGELLGCTLREWFTSRFGIRHLGNIWNKGQSGHFKEECSEVQNCDVGYRSTALDRRAFLYASRSLLSIIAPQLEKDPPPCSPYHFSAPSYLNRSICKNLAAEMRPVSSSEPKCSH